MSVAEVAALLGRTPAHVRKLLGRSVIKGYRIDGEWCVNPSDLLMYLHEHRNR
jgi:excisionase family DNA binding protein